jgi:hypothetical protein
MARDPLEPDALDASDGAEQELREGRYANVVAGRPGAAERVGAFLRPGKRWESHQRGYACARCGPTAHSKTAAHKHDWWHRWLDEMFGRIGDDIDGLEGELGTLREELLGEMTDVYERARRAEDQVAVLTRLLGPLLARTLDPGGHADEDKTIVCQCAADGWAADTPCPHCGRNGGPTHWDACHELSAA